jgi:hypothetical protein
MALQFDFNVPLCQLKNIRVKHTNGRSIHNEPRLRKNLLLAFQVENLISEGKAKDFTQAARWLNITKARLSQIMSLLNLAPSIQDEIMLSNSDKIKNITVQDILPITAESDWILQISLWNAIH